MARTSLEAPFPGWRLDPLGSRGWYNFPTFQSYQQAKEAGRDNIVTRREYMENYQEFTVEKFGWERKRYGDEYLMERDMRTWSGYEGRVIGYGPPAVISPTFHYDEHGENVHIWLWGVGNADEFRRNDPAYQLRKTHFKYIVYWVAGRRKTPSPPQR